MATTITNLTELQAMENDLAEDYVLGQNIDASASAALNGGLGFDPIGSSGSKFTGSFDGGGYTINDLTINRPTENYVGLFGYVDDAAGNFSNVGLVDCTISGEQFVGALIGYIDISGTMAISDCYSTGTVAAVDGSVGGLLGYHNAASLTDCYSTCSVTATGGANDVSEVGGLVGNTRYTVTQCYATGDVTATSDGDIEEVGGLLGLISPDATVSKSYATGNVSVTAGARAQGIGGAFGFYTSSGKASDCYARGSVTVSVGNTTWGDIGGFVGVVDDVGAVIDDCYSTGALTVTEGVSDVGGFCGDNYGTITNCFWDATTSGQATSDGGTSKTTAQMKTESTFTDAGWDFSTIWQIDAVQNNGYPSIIDVGTAPTVTTQAVSSIAGTTATGNGNITALGSPYPTAHGVCYNTTGSPTTADDTTDEGAAAATGAFTSNMTGLSINTKYYVKAYAANAVDTSYGSEVNFTTLGVPTITTQTCESVVGATATGRGEITVIGNPTPTAHGHCWNTSADPTTANSVVDNGAASVIGTFISSITGLTPGTGYYTRAYATNTQGTVYGANVYFVAPTTGIGGRAGYTWGESSNLRSFDANALERQYIHTGDVDDTPVNGATTAPISSNYMYDHVAAADPHTGYVLESLFNADTFLYASTDNTPVATSPANVLAALSGHAGAAFAWNSQNLTGIPIIFGDSTYLRIGDGGTTSHSLDSEDDLMVTGILEVDGGAYFNSFISMSANQKIHVTQGGSSLLMGDNNQIGFGGGTDGYLVYATADANAKMLHWRFPSSGQDAYNVPVLAGLGATGVITDLGLFDGVTQPAVALIEKDAKYTSASDATADTTDRDELGDVGAFASAVVGDIVRIISGDNVTAGWYWITSVAGANDSVTLDRDFASGDSTNVAYLAYHEFTMLSADGICTAITDGAPTDAGIEIDRDGWIKLDVGNNLLYARSQATWHHWTPDGGSPSFAQLTTTDVSSLCDAKAVFNSWGAVFGDAYYLFMRSDYSAYVASLNSNYLDLSGNTGIRWRVSDVGIIAGMTKDAFTLYPQIVANHGVVIGGDHLYLPETTAAITTPAKGALWLDTDDSNLHLYDTAERIIVSLTATQTLTNKTLTSPVINGTISTTGLTLPAHSVSGILAMGANNITLDASQTVDGRDLSVDGAKLDLIEAEADVTDATNVNSSGAVMESDYTTKGDTMAATGASTPVRIAVGTDTHVWTADSGEAAGVKWAAATGGSTIVWKDASTRALNLTNVTSEVSYTDLDLTSDTSASATAAIVGVSIHLNTAPSVGDSHVMMRKNGLTPTYMPTLTAEAALGDGSDMRIMEYIVGLDNGQVMEYRVYVGDTGGDINVTIDVYGYIE